MDATLDFVRRLVAADHGLAVAVTNADRSPTPSSPQAPVHLLLVRVEQGAYDEVLDGMVASLRAYLRDLRDTAPEAVDRNELLGRLLTRDDEEDLSKEDRWIQSAVSSLLIALDPPGEQEPSTAESPVGRTLYRLELLCEVRSQDQVERLLEAMAQAACPHEAGQDHECQVPWFTIASRIPDDDDEANGIRDLLNR